MITINSIQIVTGSAPPSPNRHQRMPAQRRAQHHQQLCVGTRHPPRA
ncbi:MAG: hypothetical protein R3A44_00085 [Caldilineaceae bacterium]